MHEIVSVRQRTDPAWFSA